MLVDGFKYWLLLKKDGKNYYRCRRYRNGCPGKLCISELQSGKMPQANPAHNHPVESSQALVDSFRKALTRRAATEKLDLQKIYLEEANSRHGEASLLYPYCSAQSTMAKARSKATHNTVLPEVSWQEAGEVLRTTKNFSIVYCGKRDAFYQESFSRGHIWALVFSHRPTIARCNLNEEIQVDVMCLPNAKCFLLTVHHLDKTARTTPLVYVLLSGKSVDIFTSCFAYMREKLQILPAVIISDSLQDCSVHSSLQLTWPEASIKANWFEYVESVSAQLLNLSHEVSKVLTHKTILRMILVLPFLPADYMSPGLHSIRKWMSDRKVDINVGPLGAICRFVEATWLRGVGAGKLSMFRVTTSVQDNMKEFHSQVNNYANGTVTVPSSVQKWPLWQTVEGLTMIATRVNSQQAYKARISESSKKSQLLSEAVIRNATEQWITQPIHLRSPLQFLQSASHFITKMFLSRVLRNGFEGEEEQQHKEPAQNINPMPKDPPQLAQLTNNGPMIRGNHQIQAIAANSLQIRLPSEPPPLAFLPQILDKAREQMKLLDKRKRVQQRSKEPPPLVPIIRRNK